MRAIFCKADNVGSRLIRAATWSDWSHVGIVIDGEHVIEAAWPVVRVSPLSEVIAKHSAYALVDLPCADEEAAFDALLDQIGKPYDWTAVLGLGLYRDWQDDDKWFCSELVAWAFAQGGSPLFRPETLHRITPQHLWMLSPPDRRKGRRQQQGASGRPFSFSQGSQRT